MDRDQAYEELGKIGRGAYGTVYKAKNKETGTLVALKKVCVPVTEDGVPMNTLREISILKQINLYEHPNIVRLLDICHGQRTDRELIMFLVFEHVEQDLATYIVKHSPRGFSTKEIRLLSREILQAVDFLHGNRIVHRDLKPQNILVTHDGHIKLADFGLAKTYDFDMKLTSVVVTLWYRAPEVLLGQPYATPVDIWSIGCIIVELYTLNPLFSGSNESDQLTKIFRILGKPSEEEWPEENVSIKWSTFNVTQERTVKDICPNICENAYDLIMNMLTFDGTKRITALDALKHPYFMEEPMNT